MDKTLAARRLSAAVGVQIRPTTIERVGKDGMVKLTNGMLFCLAGGNAAYKGGGPRRHRRRLRTRLLDSQRQGLEHARGREDSPATRYEIAPI